MRTASKLNYACNAKKKDGHEPLLHARSVKYLTFFSLESLAASTSLTKILSLVLVWKHTALEDASLLVREGAGLVMQQGWEMPRSLSAAYPKTATEETWCTMHLPAIVLLGNEARPNGDHKEGASNEATKGTCVQRHPWPPPDVLLCRQRQPVSS